MDVKDHLNTMAGYHRWAYGILLKTLGPMAEADYHQDCGLFFGSIHRTLNHLLLVDKLWLGRFLGASFHVIDLKQELFAERQQLADALLLTASDWIDFARDIDQQLLSGSLSYLNTKGKLNTVPYFETLMHVFNHGTHHRGQISAAMTHLKYSAPEMDLLYYWQARSQA